MHLSEINMLKSFNRLLTKEHPSEPTERYQDLISEEFDNSRSVAAILQETQNASDEMSELLAQFFNRSRYERRRNVENESVWEEVSEASDNKSPEYHKNKDIDVVYFLQKIRQLFPDDSDLILALTEFLRNQKLNKKDRKKIQDFLQEIERKTDPKDIKGGINCALKAKVYSKQIKVEPKALRHSYRWFIQNTRPIVDYYLDWIGLYGFEHRKKVIEFIEASLVDDIHSLDPSCSSSEFGNLLANLTLLKKIQSVEYGFLSPFLKDKVAVSLNISQQDWLVFFISIISEMYDFKTLLKDVLNEKIESLSIFYLAHLVQLIYRLCYTLPREVFMSEDLGEGMLSQILDLLKKISELEELAKRGLKIDREMINSIVAI